MLVIAEIQFGTPSQAMLAVAATASRDAIWSKENMTRSCHDFQVRTRSGQRGRSSRSASSMLCRGGKDAEW